MYQVKLFNSRTQGLEESINNWLKDNLEVDLFDIKYNISDIVDQAMIIYKK